MWQNKVSVISLLLLSIISSFAIADSELNLDFVQGTKSIPAVLQDGKDFPAGDYWVDIYLNKEKISRSRLNISQKEESDNVLCLKPEWLKESGIYLVKSHYETFYNDKRQCYLLGKDKNTHVDFNYGMQALKFSIPQAWLSEQTDAARWDYGVNGLRLKYYGNFNKSTHNSTDAFGNAELGVNIGAWTLATNFNASKYGDEKKFSTNSLLLSRPVGMLKGDFLLGRSQTRSELFDDFSFYGVSLRSNSNMRPWNSRGYAPLISGVATSTSRITITQEGYTIYSKVVPAGPYQLNDISPVSNGDITVTVEDEGGHKTSTIYPIATLPTMLRPGEVQYDFAIGRKNNNTDLKDAFKSGGEEFGLFSLDYGFNNTTLNSSTIFHRKYQSGGLGISQSLGELGAVSVSATVSKARYDNDEIQQGGSVGVKYAKSFSGNTNIQLLTYRYQSKGYVEFASFEPELHFPIEKNRTRYEARLSHRFGERLYLNGSFWQQSYWNYEGHNTGASLYASTILFDDISLGLSGSYSKQPYQRHSNYSISMNMSIPFSAFSSNGGYYSTSNVGYDSNSGSNMGTGISVTVNDRLNYAINAGLTSKNEHRASASVNYAFNQIQTNLALSQSKNSTSFSGGLSGTVLATAETGILLTRELSSAVGVANINGMQGIKFNNSLPSNSNGDAVVYLSPYMNNSISVDMANVPDDVELKTTSYNVVPTENAIIYRKFGFEQVMRYILLVRDKQGHLLSGGNASTEQGLNAGFIANNGVLLMNMLAAPETITVKGAAESVCRFSMKNIRANTGKVQEVRCE
ncbi:PefC/AfrB family outer membrane usher protein [Salmonella enterica]|nr:PefC/AfrB family outer membrane usher protein [Salmonella enterica]EEK3635106.1 PefC/AfrB family outer membrane usher protein [Salmonella enterica]EEK3793395.1 PefC/AfrB family outer membrane usher protein [Salmonella enterica]EEK3897170.1 PefC/AfrB family outer membrane usher protein [Salmonella enterica]EEK4034133.1 PefC/AfrB family outer membrane usher protein [Salmonella enterica]